MTNHWLLFLSPKNRAWSPWMSKWPHLGKLLGFLQWSSHPQDSTPFLNNSFLNLEYWAFQKLKMFYFCHSYLQPHNIDHSTAVLPWKQGLFHNTIWGLSNSFPLRPMTHFQGLTSVTGLHHRAQFTRGNTKAVSIPAPSLGMIIRMKRTVQRSRRLAHRFQTSRCLELPSGTGQNDCWFHTDVDNR